MFNAYRVCDGKTDETPDGCESNHIRQGSIMSVYFFIHGAMFP